MLAVRKIVIYGQEEQAGRATFRFSGHLKGAPARGPPEWYEDGADGVVWSAEGMMHGDPLAQVVPDYEQLDQRVSW